MNKVEKSSWQQVVSATKEWHNTFEQFRLTDEVNMPVTEYNPILCEKEWEAIKAIKEWKKNPNFYFTLQDFSESEKQSFELLNGKSQNIFFVENDSKPYKKVFYVPISVWNDDPDAYPDYIPLKNGTVIGNYASHIHSFFMNRTAPSMESFFKGSKTDTLYSIDVKNLWLKNNIDQCLKEGINLLDKDMDTIEHSLLKRLAVITKEFQSDWLQSAIMPIIVSAKDYDDIADFDFNHDGLFNVEANELKTVRYDFEEPTSLSKAVDRLESIRFSLWAKTVVYDNFVEGGVKRETQIYCHLKENEIVSISAAVMDIDENDDELITLTNHRSIKTPYDIQETLLPWILCSDTRMMWSVIYVDEEDKDDEELSLPGNYKMTYGKTTLH